MNKLKRFMALLSSTVILGTMGLFTVSATGKETHPYKVSNGNWVLSDVNGYMVFDDEHEIYAYKRDNFTLSLIVEGNTEITNELLEISEDYTIERSETSSNVYVISFETEDETNKLFEKSS